MANLKTLAQTQQNVINTTIAAASGTTPVVDVKTKGSKAMAVLLSASASAIVYVEPYMKNGTRLTGARLLTGTAGTSQLSKFDLSGIEKVAVSVKDNSATANNVVVVDIALSDD